MQNTTLVHSFDESYVEIPVSDNIVSVHREKLIRIVDDNDELPWAGIMLEKMITVLDTKYWIKVELTKNPVTVKEEIAQWKNQTVKVDVRKRGTLWSLFLLSHVFGHLVQFSSDIDYNTLLSHIKNKTPPINLSDDFKKEYFSFENEAFQLWRTVMEESFDMDTEFWILYSTFAYTDYEHYWKYLTKAKGSTKNEFHVVWKNFINWGLGDTIISVPLPNSVQLAKNCDESIIVI
jgi:hypothetical protein